MRPMFRKGEKIYLVHVPLSLRGALNCKSTRDICVEHMNKSLGSVQFCGDLSLAGERQLPHSDLFFCG